MAITTIDQETQIRQSTTYDDTITPSEAAFETNPVDLMADLNNIRSQLSNLLDAQAGNWWDDLNTPSTLETGTQRGVNDLNTGLHAVEKKRVIRCVDSVTDITVPGGQNYVILGAGQLPPTTTAAVGAVTSLGTVAAFHAGTFGTHSLDEVAGVTTINPKNLVLVVDGATRDPILDSNGRRIYGLLQTETATDGHTITDTTTTRAQISFVTANATGDDLIAAPIADIAGDTVNVCWPERVRWEDLSEQDFLSRMVVDVPAGTTVSRQVAYDNQSTTPVDLTNNATLDLEGAGLVWSIRDDAEATLFAITEGSAGGTSQVQIAAGVDLYNNDAVDVDFASGATINSGGTRPIDVGVTDGVIATTAGDLGLTAFAEMLLSDGNKAASSYAGALKLSETSTEWDNFETQFGEVSILNAIVQASQASNITAAFAVVTANVNADTNMTGAGGTPNLDAQLPDHSAYTFANPAQVRVELNGVHQRTGADAAANFDVYPGVTPANGDLRFEKKLKVGDVIYLELRG